MAGLRWIRERWPTIRDNAVYDVIKWAFLALAGVGVYWFMKFLLPAVSALSPDESRVIACITALFVFASASVAWGVAATTSQRAMRISIATNMQSVAAPQQPRIVYIASRITDAYLSNNNNALRWSSERYDRHAGALVLVFQSEPLGDGVASAKIPTMHATMTFTNANERVRIPAAIWVGHFDSCRFQVGDTRELVVALKLGRGFKFPYVAVEARRSASSILPPHYPVLALGNYTVKVSLFDAPNGQYVWNFEFDVTLGEGEDTEPTARLKDPD